MSRSIPRPAITTDKASVRKNTAGADGDTVRSGRVVPGGGVGQGMEFVPAYAAGIFHICKANISYRGYFIRFEEMHFIEKGLGICQALFSGTPGWIRTSGLPLRRRPLYPTELRGHNNPILAQRAAGVNDRRRGTPDVSGARVRPGGGAAPQRGSARNLAPGDSF